MRLPDGSANAFAEWLRDNGLTFTFRWSGKKRQYVAVFRQGGQRGHPRVLVDSAGRCDATSLINQGAKHLEGMLETERAPTVKAKRR